MKQNRLENLILKSIEHKLRLLLSEFFYPLLGRARFRAGVEQPFNCLIVQNRQSMQSMMRSMDWTLEDNMVDGSFFCPHSQAAEEAIPHLYKQESKRPTPVRRWLSRTPAVLGRAILGGWVPMSGMKVRGLVVLSNHSAFQW